MANKKLFKSTSKTKKTVIPPVDTVNSAGGVAYEMSAKHALSQLAATGTFGSTFYISEEDQLAKVKELISKVEPSFLAKVAVYARQKGFMKDMPAYLAAVLASKDSTLLRKIFDRVIDDGKMVRNFVQIMRSGVTGRKSLGTVSKKLVNKWINSAKDETLFRASVGNDPSLADVIKMTHPSPENDKRAAFYGYLLDKEHNAKNLPEIVKKFEAYKKDKSGEVPDVDFRMLTSLELGKSEWTEIARKANWHTARMNLNTFKRHGVFENDVVTKTIADKLADAETVAKIKVFPYQLLAAYKATEGESLPIEITNALQSAMELATNNIPEIAGKVYIFPDVSGSMSSGSVTGNRGSASSKIRPVDVAALVAASILRKNPSAEVIPFEGHVVPVKLNPHDSVMTNAGKLSSIGGGSTNCSAPLQMLNMRKATGDLCIFISDNESWVDSRGGFYGRGTATMNAWTEFKRRNPNARLVCIDVSPNTSVQAVDRDDILNIGGFSDNVFEVISLFNKNGLGSHWTDVIEQIKLD